MPGPKLWMHPMATPLTPLPSVVRNWLIAHYLRDPMPSQYLPNNPEPMALARFDDFAEFLMDNGIDLMPNLDNWKAAGWIDDILVHHSQSTDPKRAAEFRDARLKLPAGRHRLVAIRKAVLSAPVSSPIPKDPRSPKGRGGKPPISKSNPQLVNLYDLVLVEWWEGRPWNEIIEALQAKKDVMDLAKRLKKVITRQLIRNAKKYRDENPRI